MRKQVNNVEKCMKSLGHFNWRLQKKTVTVSTIVGTVPGLFIGEPKETFIWAFVPVIAAWISSTMRASPYATPAIHVVVVAWPSSPVDGASQKGARYARPSSTIFTLTIVDPMLYLFCRMNRNMEQ